jgi:vancomycin resistance protein YoaR
LRLGLVLVGAVALVVIAAGVIFAGSSDRIAGGVKVAGVDVGGLTAAQARAKLEQRSQALLHVPATFVAGGRSFRVAPDSLGIRVDWKTAVAEARRRGNAFGPLRGLRRIDVRVFGAEVAPTTAVFRGALELELAHMAKTVDRPHREPALALRGLHPVVVPGRRGVVLDRAAASPIILDALASFDRGAPVQLPVRTDRPRLAPAALAPALFRARRMLAAPLRLTLGPTRFRLSRPKIARLLQLPAGGSTQLAVGGVAAGHWLDALAKHIGRPPTDAQFTVDGSTVHVVPAKPGLTVDREATSAALLRAGLRLGPRRVAPIAVTETVAKRTTAEARAMGVTELVSSYTTIFGGIANRIHNVQLVAHLVDNKLIAPGATFSFNGTTGERTAAKGFLEAPVIINGELETGLGGGVCQVSTTVFNAAYEAGLKITERHNHALYISHYPQGRDATVDYPDLDLKFVNDTDHWLLLRTFVSSSELTVNLYGTSPHRRIVSSVTPLVTTGPSGIEKTIDPSLAPGERVVDDPGSPSLATSATRKVYDADGKLLYDDTWYSSYRAEPKLVRIGPKKPKPEKPAKPGETTTTPVGTGPTQTAPLGTTPTQTAPAQTATAQTAPAP